MVRARVSEDLRPSCHALAELFGKGSKRSFIDPDRSQPVPRKCYRYPSNIHRSASRYGLARPYLVDDAGEPGAPLRRVPKCEEPVASRHRPGTRQQKVLDVIEFEHSPFSQLLLHLVQHAGKRGLQLESFLDLVCTHVRIFSVFQKTRALMVAYELDERRGVRLPVLGKALQVLEDGIDAVL